MVDTLEKNRTASLEVLLIDPELADGIRADEEDAFTWKADEYERLNYLTFDDLSVNSLKAKIGKFHKSGFSIVVLIDRLNSQLVKNLSQIGDELVPAIKIATWESYGKELMNFVDFPQAELFDDELVVNVENEAIRTALASALKEWLPQNMEMTNERINEIISKLDPTTGMTPLLSTSEKTEPSLPLTKKAAAFLTSLPDWAAEQCRQFLENIDPKEPIFSAGALAAGKGQLDDIKLRLFGFGTSEEIEFKGQLHRGAENEPDKFEIRASSKDARLMNRLRVMVVTNMNKNSPVMLEMKSQADIQTTKDQLVQYRGEMTLEEDEHIKTFEIIDMRGKA